MEMRHIRAFLAVARELHFGRAAATLHVAQPAVSTAIQQLEDEVGAVLFERTRRRVALSPAGQHLRPALEEALRVIERGVQSAQRAARGETGRVVVQFAAMAGLVRLPEALSRFKKARPDVQVVVTQAGTVSQLDAVRAGRADLAFTIMPGDVRPLASAVVSAEPMVVVLPEGHPLAGRRSIRFAQFAHEPVLILPRATEPAIGQAYLAMCREAGVEPRIGMELEQVETLLAFVAAGLGVTLMPATVARLGFEGITTVRLRPAIAAEATLVWDPERLSPAAAALLEEVRRAPERGATRR